MSTAADPKAVEPPLRLFLALWPDAATRRGLAAWRDAFGWPRAAAPVPDERLHLTLHFIGNVAAARLPELGAGLRVPVTPFELCLDEAVVWPHGLAVLGARRPSDRLAALHAALAGALVRLGLPVEQRAFRPHVTLARRAAGARPDAGVPPVHWAVQGYCLVQSADGYRRLVDYPGPPDARRVSR